ncbi:MAG: hypothetical protein L0191_09825, partial [Acidobacteria bacterium]|nr:hypothetical protein [Acidobacteriota bacterium]
MLVTPYIPPWPYLEAAAVDGGGVVNTVAWPVANTALYVPVWFPEDSTLSAITFFASNGTGNYDLGLYDSSLARIASSGSTAMSAAGIKSLSLSSLAVTSDQIYYAALALS